MTSTPEAPGANCGNGGVRYTSASGVNYVCNGSGGSDTAARTLAKLLTVDGSGSRPDADTLDGIDSAGLVRTGQFGGLFNGALGDLFGTDDSTASKRSRCPTCAGRHPAGCTTSSRPRGHSRAGLSRRSGLARAPAQDPGEWPISSQPPGDLERVA